MRTSLLIVAILVFWQSSFAVTAVMAQDPPPPAAGDEAPPPQQAEDGEAPPPESEALASPGGMTADPQDPMAKLRDIAQRGTERKSVLPFSPLLSLRDFTDETKKNLYDATGLKVGIAIHHLFQWYSDALPGTKTWGMATDADIVLSWELLDRGKPTQGQVVAGFEGRWQYGNVEGPTNLSVPSIGSLSFPANTYAAYTPTFLPVRNLYWEQGSPEAGWAYRIGKITPDQIVSTSRHLAPTTTFLSILGTGSFSNGLSDSGLGVAGAWYINEDMKLVGVIADSNANRQDFGDIGQGQFYKALEFGFKFFPQTPKAGYCRLTLWHNDGTVDGSAINGSTGQDGWGFIYKHEQEITSDGRIIMILKYGHGFDDSSLYTNQAGASLLVYEPFGPHLENDLFGAAFNWGDATAGVRDEYNLEVFYRFPVFPLLDVTLSYQLVINPALDVGIDSASIFSLRLVTTF